MKRAGASVLGVAMMGAVLLGCGHTETYQAMFRQPEPPTGRAVELYMADQSIPARAYYEVALVQAIGFGSDSHPEDLAVALSEKAAKLGCDAVVRVFLDQGYARANASGVCIRWVGPPVAGAPPGPTTLTPSPPPPQPPSKMLPAPAPRMEPLPSAGPSGGGSVGR